MTLPTLEFYGSLDCPYAYLAVYRLRQIWPEYGDRVQVAWRCLSLEYINKRPVTQPLIAAERQLFAQIEPALPFEPWSRADWDWPVTMWPAFEALACAQAQNADAAFAMSWALRFAFYAESRNIALRHEIMALAEQVAKEAPLDVAQFEEDWDGGRHKAAVIADSRRGWHELKLEGSATFILPNGRRLTNPAIGEIDFDEENYVVRSYEAFEGNVVGVYKEMFETGGVETGD